MNAGYSKPEIEKPKPTKAERRAIAASEARTLAGYLEADADALNIVHGSNNAIASRIRRAVAILRELPE
jgi:hypothetical protein